MNQPNPEKNARKPRAPRAPKAAAQSKPEAGKNGKAKPAPKAAQPAENRPADNARRKPFYSRTRRPQQKQKNGPAATPMHIIPLGGLGEVGKNITLYECQGDMLMVDCGLVFPDSDMFGIDLVIPDFTYVVQNKDKIKGVIITHGHEDHIGALPYLLKQVNLPVYATRLTIGLIKNKLEEHGLLGRTKLVEITPRRKFKLGCFTIDPIHVNHSIPDAVAFAIECPAGVVIQTGDFKIDYTPLSGGPTDLAAFAEYGAKGVLALLSDSTNAERPGFTATEKKVAQSFANLFRRADKQRIIIATFASNLYRIQQIIDLAVENGRKVAVSGRSMANNTQMALELGYLHAPEGVLIDVEKIKNYFDREIVIVSTGTQGEPMSALTRMAAGDFNKVTIGPNDTIIISANPIPGNERMVYRVINNLYKKGANVVYESLEKIHVSGHACQEEHKILHNLLDPKFFIPVHGEYRHLKRHALLAEELGMPARNILITEIGNCVELTEDSIRLGENFPAGTRLIDGEGGRAKS